MKGPSGSGGHIIERGDPGHRFIRTKGEGGGGLRERGASRDGIDVWGATTID